MVDQDVLDIVVAVAHMVLLEHHIQDRVAQVDLLVYQVEDLAVDATSADEDDKNRAAVVAGGHKRVPEEVQTAI